MNKLAKIGLFVSFGFSAAAQTDNIYTPTMSSEKQPLSYDYVHEKDVLWEKRVWREIDTKVKRNQHFSYAQNGFADILLRAARSGEITAYSSQTDDFSIVMTPNDMMEFQGDIDTFYFDIEGINGTSDADNPPTKPVVVNGFDASDIEKYRLKEVWYMDEESSNIKVRILGIAPVVDRYDDNGNLLHTTPLCWFYYPELRPLLAHKEAFNTENDAHRMSWEDVFEARLFDSQITKVSNAQDVRLQDIFIGIERPLVSEKISDELFDVEQELWKY